ncbi:uncharacterized protein YALI1_E09835g [Yarrowia lipolytica]|uniref:Uncharacterized protein n=1 Tax=Yarrowia lipolytica TaxID=4952 RepID=A0A1D8NHK7_YARLL|nr:hypothetical protein YALI1_E09835g [Yarrowia lipolytica]
MTPLLRPNQTGLLSTRFIDLQHATVYMYLYTPVHLSGLVKQTHQGCFWQAQNGTVRSSISTNTPTCQKWRRSGLNGSKKG